MNDHHPEGEIVEPKAMAGWQKPELRKLQAGAAENGNGVVTEGGFGVS